jgi:hypothetical protein
MRTVDKPLALPVIARRQKVLNAKQILARGRGSRNGKVNFRMIHSTPGMFVFRPRIRDLEEISATVIVHQTVYTLRQSTQENLSRPFVEDVALHIALIPRATDHETDFAASRNHSRFNGIGVVHGERTTATSYICIFGTEDGESFEPEVIVGSGIARDVADVLKFFGDCVVDDEAIEYIWTVLLVRSGGRGWREDGQWACETATKRKVGERYFIFAVSSKLVYLSLVLNRTWAVLYIEFGSISGLASSSDPESAQAQIRRTRATQAQESFVLMLHTCFANERFFGCFRYWYFLIGRYLDEREAQPQAG